ncbi:polysaccharide deacetylase family protein [Bacillota bacterium]
MKIYKITGPRIKTFIQIPLLIGVVIAVFVTGNIAGGGTFPMAAAKERLLPIYSVGTEEKEIAISFDAAWGNSHTEKILDILDEYGVKTTFFLVEFWADKYPDEVKEISRRGHEVENHSATHPDMTTLSVDEIRREVESTGVKIEELTGIKPGLFRPPFGAYDNKVIDTIEGMGYKVIQWSVDSHDWMQISTDQIVERVVSRIVPGSIVLFHNDAARVEEYLPRILEKAAAEGYKVIPIGQLIYREDYHIDHTGKQIKN